MHTKQVTDTAQGLLECLSSRQDTADYWHFRVIKLERVNYFRVQQFKDISMHANSYAKQ